MNRTLSQLVTRNSWYVVVGWLLLAATLYLLAPSWSSITKDGDFVYLPPRMPSVEGEQMVSRAFPTSQAKSQIVVVIARSDSALTDVDRRIVCADIGRRLQFLQGCASMARSYASPDEDSGRLSLEIATQSFGKSIELDRELREYAAKSHPDLSITPLVGAHWGKAQLLQATGEKDEASAIMEAATKIAPDVTEFEPIGIGLPFSDTWSWRDRYFGKRLGQEDRHFRLMVLQSVNEFMAVDNIEAVRAVERQLDSVRESYPGLDLPTVAISGSAVVGADMLLAAKASISQTEIVTIILVVGILVFVYRAPILVFIPLASIGIALLVSSSLIALFVQAGEGADWQWKVFSTTRIFIIVILFGAGTDYCLFLIARYREELPGASTPQSAVAKSTERVAEPLITSAVTTILGLVMMYFAEFEKFRYSGPVISFALLVTVVVTLTLTPALLRIFGKRVFWPYLVDPDVDSARNRTGLWTRLSTSVVRSPLRILFVCLFVMVPFFVVGIRSNNAVSYDVLASLPADCRSRHGMKLLEKFLPQGENGPISIVCHRTNGDLATPAGKTALAQLASRLHQLPDVKSVRSIYDPLGELGPSQNSGVLTTKGFGIRVLRAHRRVRTAFVTEQPGLIGKVARLDVVLNLNPFSAEAMTALDQIESVLKEQSDAQGSFWYEADFSFAGTTAGIRDLRKVTQSDQLRIEWLVVAAVSLVLLFILRHPLICLYMIVTILFTYYVTMGATQLFFQWSLGSAYLGLDWKVPIFVFVILVAVGQDYNVYLASRVLEEQRRSGPFRGLQTAIVSTGGIISSCGLIMTGTFLSMTSGAWRNVVVSCIPGLEPWLGTNNALMSIVQLGFALALGICLDTFIVRPVLLPACLSLSLHAKSRQSGSASLVNAEALNKVARTKNAT